MKKFLLLFLASPFVAFSQCGNIFIDEFQQQLDSDIQANFQDPIDELEFKIDSLSEIANSYTPNYSICSLYPSEYHTDCIYELDSEYYTLLAQNEVQMYFYYYEIEDLLLEMAIYEFQQLVQHQMTCAIMLCDDIPFPETPECSSDEVFIGYQYCCGATYDCVKVGCTDPNAYNFDSQAGCNENCIYSITEYINHLDQSEAISVDLFEGWNMFGYVCSEPAEVTEALSIYSENIILVKDYLGAAFLPEFNFNGIGDLLPGYGYQIKVSETIEDFSLCSPDFSIIPIDAIQSLETSIDQLEIVLSNNTSFFEDSIYSLLSILDTLSPNYLTLLDIISSYESVYLSSQQQNDSLQAELDSIYGCTLSDACNYDSNAILDDESCWNAEQGYDCEGNLMVNCYDPEDSEFVDWLLNNHPSVMYDGCLNIYAASYLESSLSIENTSITNLDGLEYFTNIDSLLINNNDSLINISNPIILPNLTFLQFNANNNLTNISDLSGLSNLNYLWIQNNESLSSLPDISGLTNLTDLLIFHNDSLSSLSNLSGLTNLAQLVIFDNDAITTIPDLSGLTNLSQLDIYYNNAITTISDLSGLINLTNLEIFYNDSLECVEGYPEQLTIQESWPPVCLQYQVGDIAEGGIVFYIDETGEHGLVAAMEDLTEGATIDSEGNPGYQWGCFATGISGADGQSIGTGYQNTIDIVNQGCTTEYGGISAAQAAFDSELNSNTDWYLPSLDELNEMYNTIGTGGSEGNIGGFSSNWYWSSSESNNYGAYDVNFGDGSTGNFSSKTKIVRVRVIRSF